MNYQDSPEFRAAYRQAVNDQLFGMPQGQPASHSGYSGLPLWSMHQDPLTGMRGADMAPGLSTAVAASDIADLERAKRQPSVFDSPSLQDTLARYSTNAALSGAQGLSALGMVPMLGGLTSPARKAAKKAAMSIADWGTDTAQTLPGQISTRFPTAMKAPEDPMSHDLVVGLPSSLADPNAAARNAELIKGYDNFQLGGRRNPERIMDQLIEHERENLNFLYDQVPGDIREETKRWYDGANLIAHNRAQQFGVTPEAASGVYAAMSPQKDWYMNVALGDRVMDIMRNRADMPWSGEMDQTLARIGQKIKNPAHQMVIQNIRGKRLADLDDPVERALWVRINDQAYNDPSYQAVTPSGEFGDIVRTKSGAPGRLAWGSLNEIASAISVLDDQSIENISRRMGQQHKVRNFYNNIIAPGSQRGDVTIDTHAVAAGLLQPYAGKDAPVLHNFGSGLKGQGGPGSSAVSGNRGTYGVHAEAYRRAAADQGVLPREMQSITWEAVRGLFDNKSAKIKQTASNIWQDYKSGLITQGQAQKQIMNLAGGINEPTWLK